MKLKISLYVQNGRDFALIMVSLLIHTSYMLITLNTMDYSWRVLSFTLYGIIFTLLTFYLGTKVKVYEVKGSYFIIILNVLNLFRLLISPTKLNYQLITLMLVSSLIGIYAGVKSYLFSKQRDKYISNQEKVK